MKKKLLVFFMIFILIFTCTINIFGAIQMVKMPLYIINHSPSSIIFSLSTSFNTTNLVSSGDSVNIFENSSSSSYLYFKLNSFGLYTITYHYDRYPSTSYVSMGVYNPSNNSYTAFTINDYDISGNYVTFSYDFSNFDTSTIFYINEYAGNRYIDSLEFYLYIPPFYQPFIDFHVDLLSNTFSFIPDLFGNSYLNLTVFIIGILSILFMIFIITFMIKKFTRGC